MAMMDALGNDRNYTYGGSIEAADAMVVRLTLHL